MEGEGWDEGGRFGWCRMASDAPLSEGEAGNEATSRQDSERARMK